MYPVFGIYLAVEGPICALIQQLFNCVMTIPGSIVIRKKHDSNELALSTKYSYCQTSPDCEIFHNRYKIPITINI